jgi:RNAse (barnase) inhibitor barstar
MPVRKFRTIEEMNAFDDERRQNLDAEHAGRRLSAIWELTGGPDLPLNFPKGVHKFRTIEEMNAFKDRYINERIELLRQRVKK